MTFTSGKVVAQRARDGRLLRPWLALAMATSGAGPRPPGRCGSSTSGKLAPKPPNSTLRSTATRASISRPSTDRVSVSPSFSAPRLGGLGVHGHQRRAGVVGRPPAALRRSPALGGSGPMADMADVVVVGPALAERAILSQVHRLRRARAMIRPVVIGRAQIGRRASAAAAEGPRRPSASNSAARSPGMSVKTSAGAVCGATSATWRSRLDWISTTAASRATPRPMAGAAVRAAERGPARLARPMRTGPRAPAAQPARQPGGAPAERPEQRRRPRPRRRS